MEVSCVYHSSKYQTPMIFLVRNIPFQDVAKAGLKFGDEGLAILDSKGLPDSHLTRFGP